MAAVTTYSGFRAQEEKSITVFTYPLSICHEKMGLDSMILLLMLSFKPAFSLSSFTFVNRLITSSSVSAIKVISSAFFRFLIFLLEILIPAYNSSSPTFCTLCSVLGTEARSPELKAEALPSEPSGKPMK